MARYKILLFIMIASSLSVYLYTQSFVVKKQRRVSSTTLKQNVGQLLGELLKVSAAHIKNLAHMQEGALEKTYQLLEQDTESFFAQANTEQLQNCYEELGIIVKKIRGSYKEQLEHFEKLQSLFCLVKKSGKAV